jgi:hypothetical protein
MLKIERDVSTGQWLVVRHFSYGWSVLFRAETRDAAIAYRDGTQR